MLNRQLQAEPAGESVMPGRVERMRQRASERQRQSFCLLLLLAFISTGAGCRRSESGQGEGAANANAAAEAEELSTPPFATREPERYQATRIISSGGNGQPNETAAGALGSRTLIARDGERRREDYESPSGATISYLQLESRTFVLLPSKKVYAELKPGDGEPVGSAASPPADFSPEKLLNETRTGASYQKLGTESVNGRAATKYRVTVRAKTGAASEVVTVSLVWIDESLGMPIRTETTSTGGAARGSQFSMELRDIKEEVDASLFELPPDYRQLDYKEMLAELRGAGG
ncbi:MAG TPA: hypothetical protein VF723_00110 [Pyrinomonadaceae bacterium]|jgi:outer membrane lipoprotein-sorting protein